MDLAKDLTRACLAAIKQIRVEVLKNSVPEIPLETFQGLINSTRAHAENITAEHITVFQDSHEGLQRLSYQGCAAGPSGLDLCNSHWTVALGSRFW